jgi:hypothetical protein
MGQAESVSVGLASHALRGVRRTALLLALVVVSGCSNFAMDTEFRPETGPDPSYRTLVVNQVKATFKNYPSYNSYELSEARWVHSVSGWGWLACIRFQDQGHRRTYVMVIKDKAVVDSRFAVETDACDAVAYSPLDLGTGAVPVVPVAGQLSPLY